MKNFFIFLLCLSVFTSCKNETKTVIPPTDADTTVATTKDDLTTLGGEFIYYADAAVLQSGNSIYGVIINDKAEEIHRMGKSYRKEPTDGIHVLIKAKIIPKTEGEEGWPFILDIKEIVSVKALNAKQNEVVKIGK